MRKKKSLFECHKFGLQKNACSRENINQDPARQAAGRLRGREGSRRELTRRRFRAQKVKGEKGWPMNNECFSCIFYYFLVWQQKSIREEIQTEKAVRTI